MIRIFAAYANNCGSSTIKAHEPYSLLHSLAKLHKITTGFTPSIKRVKLDQKCTKNGGDSNKWGDKKTRHY